MTVLALKKSNWLKREELKDKRLLIRGTNYVTNRAIISQKVSYFIQIIVL